MSSAGPPSKRRRQVESDETPDSDEPVKQSARCWFDDGNVILQAERVQFRVHRSVLAYHSDIMKDCFGCPQPEDAETLDGCPVTHLPQDSAADIENMCVLLYGAKQCAYVAFFGIFSVNLDAIEQPYLMTMIRIGRKYEIRTFTEMALAYLRKLFPRDQELWVASRPKVHEIVTNSKDFLFDIVNLAYENEIPSILPAALLDLYTHHSLVRLRSLITTIPTDLPSWLRMKSYVELSFRISDEQC
ncbi:hypothetical protein HYPSUDRAFT_147960 [Hypholoma sublateritium FD-334 SS-4]|uniref:BTB domain-containing protein n=1 Tax=Hypholoma sublateritium (strain FD-334 SS-4) TaxID=945553 RepID=A0A0D2P7A9_HYPSF|nr:hypothetical protein HYPSUDRAFT_147960 [Hypholoma sublateritium FD-334 SS-4]